MYENLTTYFYSIEKSHWTMYVQYLLVVHAVHHMPQNFYLHVIG